MTGGDGGVMRVPPAPIDRGLRDGAAQAPRVRETLAAVPDADLVVFPGLALTGYQATGAGDVALGAGDPQITGLGGAGGGHGGGAGVAGGAPRAGFPEAPPPHTHTAAASVENGAVRHVHRKLNLPTYDIWQERRRFVPGAQMQAFDTRFGRMAILICADAWQPALAALAVRDGARVLVVPAASALRHPDIEETWRDISRFYARTLHCYVV